MVTWLHARRREGETAMLWISSINPLNAWIMEIKFVGIEEQHPMLEEEDAPGDFYYYFFFSGLLIHLFLDFNFLGFL